MSNARPEGSSAARSCADPATTSLVPTATSTGARIVATSARVKVWREPRIQAASASRSDLVCSAKARNVRPTESLTSASEGASSACAIVERDHAPPSVGQRRNPARIDPIHLGGRSETVHEDDRIALPFIEKRDFHALVLKTLHVRTAQSLVLGPHGGDARAPSHEMES